MSELGDVLGAPKTVTIRGKEYKVSPLTLNRLAEMEDHIRRERLKDSVEALKAAELSERVIADKLIELNKAAVTTDEVNEFMATMTGVKKILHAALKQHQPNIKEDDMAELVALDNFDEMTELVKQLGGATADEAEGEQPKNVNKGKGKS